MAVAFASWEADHSEMVKFAISIVTIFGLFSVTSANAQPPAKYEPLTAKQRAARYFREAFLSPAPYLAASGSAIGEQSHKAPPEWGQGTAGYATRVASRFGLETIETTVHEGMAAAMGLEPRYMPCECKGFRLRLRHALKMGFLTYNNQGKLRPDLPSMGGAFAAGMISQYWFPDRFNPLTDGVRAGVQQFGFHVGLQVLREFAPEIRRTLHIKP